MAVINPAQAADKSKPVARPACKRPCTAAAVEGIKVEGVIVATIIKSNVVAAHLARPKACCAACVAKSTVVSPVLM